MQHFQRTFHFVKLSLYICQFVWQHCCCCCCYCCYCCTFFLSNCVAHLWNAAPREDSCQETEIGRVRERERGRANREDYNKLNRLLWPCYLLLLLLLLSSYLGFCVICAQVLCICWCICVKSEPGLHNIDPRGQLLTDKVPQPNTLPPIPHSCLCVCKPINKFIFFLNMYFKCDLFADCILVTFRCPQQQRRRPTHHSSSVNSPTLSPSPVFSTPCHCKCQLGILMPCQMGAVCCIFVYGFYANCWPLMPALPRKLQVFNA